MSAWSPEAGRGPDDLTSAALGLCAGARRLLATIEAAAPPVTAAEAEGAPAPDILALLGLIAVCERIEAVFDAIEGPAAPRRREAVTSDGGSLLR